MASKNEFVTEQRPAVWMCAVKNKDIQAPNSLSRFCDIKQFIVTRCCLHITQVKNVILWVHPCLSHHFHIVTVISGIIVAFVPLVPRSHVITFDVVYKHLWNFSVLQRAHLPNLLLLLLQNVVLIIA